MTIKPGDTVDYKDNRGETEPMIVLDVQKDLGVQIRRGEHTVWIRKSLLKKVA